MEYNIKDNEKPKSITEKIEIALDFKTSYEKIKSIIEKIEVALDFKTPSEMMRIKTLQPYKTHTPSNQEDASKEIAKLMLKAHFLLNLLSDNGKEIEDIIDNDEIRCLNEIGVFDIIDFPNNINRLEKDHDESKHNRFYDHAYENLPKKVFTGHDAAVREELSTVELKVDYIHMMLLKIMEKLEVE